MTRERKNVPAGIREKLSEFEAIQRGVSIKQTSLEVLALIFAALATLAIVLRVVHPPLAIRIALTVSFYAMGFWFLLKRVVVRLTRRRSDSELAADFEKAAGGRLNEQVVSAVELAQQTPPGTSSWMVGQTIEKAVRAVEAYSPGNLIDRGPLRRAMKYAIAASIYFLCLAIILPAYMLNALNPFAASFQTARTQLHVQPGNVVVRASEPLRIEAIAIPAPEASTLLIEWKDGLKEELNLARVEGTNGFAHSFFSVDQDFKYRVKAGDAASPEYQVQLQQPPKLESLKVQISPPAYAKWPQKTIDGGDAEILAGSKLTMIAKVSGANPRSIELLSEEIGGKAFRVGSREGTLEMTPRTNFNYTLKLVGTNELTMQPSDQWKVRLFSDGPPIITLTVDAIENNVVDANEILTLRTTASDDVGIKKVDILVSRSGTNLFAKSIPVENAVRTPAGGQTIEETTALNLAEFKPGVGEDLDLSASVTDIAGQTTRSEAVQIRIAKPQDVEKSRLAAALRRQLQAADLAFENFRQTRSQWLTWLRNENEDLAPESGALLLKQRLDQIREQLREVSSGIRAESGLARTQNLAPFLFELSGHVAALGDAQARMLDRAISQMINASDDKAKKQARNIGQMFFDNAAEDFRKLRERIALAPNFLETDLMVARDELEQAKYKRALPLLAKGMGWDEKTEGGLAAAFFKNKNLSGAPAVKKIAFPKFDDLNLPEIGGVNWSARYEGEFNVTEKGKWNFQVNANDGARLTVNGKKLLPDNSWADSGAREFKASVELEAGWRPIQVEFFQSGGHSQLHVRAGKEGAPLQELSEKNLRPAANKKPAPPAPERPLLAKGELQETTNRIATSFKEIARISGHLNRITNDVPQHELIRLAAGKTGTGTEIEHVIANGSSWSPDHLRTAESKSDELFNAARDARRILQDMINGLRWHMRGSAELQALRLPMMEIRSAIDEIRPLTWENKKRQDVLDRKPEEITAANAWTDELQKQTQKYSRNFFEEAKSRESSLAERAAALKASMKLEKEVAESIQSIQKILTNAPTAKELVENVVKELDKIENQYNEASAAGDMRMKAQSAELAESGLRQLRGQIPDALNQTVQNIEALERQRGDESRAERLEIEAAKSDTKDLANDLRELRNRLRENPQNLSQTIPPPIEQEVKNLERLNTKKSESADRLARPRVGLAIESERSRREGNPKLGEAFRQVGVDLGDLIQKANEISAEKLRPIAERAAALAGARGDAAKEAEINAAMERAAQWAKNHPGQEQNGNAMATRLEQLAKDANEAAYNKPKRSPLNDNLNGLAQSGAQAQAGSTQQMAGEAAVQAESDIQSGPNEPESYREAAQDLSAAAQELRLGEAAAEASAAQMAAMTDNFSDSDLMAADKSESANGQSDLVQGNDFARMAGEGSSLNQKLSAADRAEWARLQARLQKALRNGGIEHFTEEQQEFIRSYFKRLGSEK